MKQSFSQLKFGTSGLRGVVEAFQKQTINAYVTAFLETIELKSNQVFVGIDLRESSPQIAKHVCDSIAQKGLDAIYCGVLPTPALALYAMSQNAPAIMVTGSHIPSTHNGLKFYRPNSEFLKEDEAPVYERAQEIFQRNLEIQSGKQLPEPSKLAIQNYVTRYTNNKALGSLSGAKIGVYQHSSASRDILVDILKKLGAQVFPYGSQDHFHAVDTEAFSEEELRTAKSQIDKNGLFAVVSTDGDGDRPLVIDETGTQINGDVLGAITAKQLAVTQIATPITATTGIEHSGWFTKILRTRVGSPFVVSAMSTFEGEAVGFEPNGGFLTGCDLSTSMGKFSALPTRDAVLPLLVVLMAARKREIDLSQLIRDLPPRFMLADRLKNVPAALSRSLLKKISQSKSQRIQIHPDLANPDFIDLVDGVRLGFNDGRIVHFRASGNAPEFRCYVETENVERTQGYLKIYVSALKRVLQ